MPEQRATIIGQMNSSKAEIRDRVEDSQAPKKPISKKRKKSRLKRLICWLLVDLVVAILLFGLLIHRPERYRPLSSAGFTPGQISPYWLQLSSKIYNGGQLGEPFDVEVSEAGINDMLARENYVWEHDGVVLYAPAAVLTPGRAVLMGTANLRGMEFVITIELEPKINEEGLLHLAVAKLKIGAMNITPIAKMMARKMYTDRLDTVEIDTEAWQTKVAGSLLNDDAFEPIFPISLPVDKEDIHVRVEKVSIKKGKMELRLIPIP